MARVCALTGKKVLFGNKVSHANNKTRRKFLPNLQKVSFLSDLLGLSVKIKLSTHAVRTVEKNGGLDNYLLKTSSSVLSDKMKKMKKLLASKIVAKI